MATRNQIDMEFNEFIDDDTFASATATNVASAESIKAYVDNQIVTATDWVLLQSSDVNSVASIEFTDLSLDYFAYKILMDYVIPITDGVGLQLQLSTDNGLSWINSAASYRSMRATNSASGVTPSGGQSVSAMTMALNTGNTSFVAGLWGEITVYLPMESATRCTVTSHVFNVNSSGNGESVTGGHQRLNNEANNAMRLLFASGNIASARVRLYGIRRT